MPCFRTGRPPSIPKALKAELTKDNWLLLQFGIAKELGITLAHLRCSMTPEEVIGWSCYFSVLNDEQQTELEKAKRRR